MILEIDSKLIDFHQLIEYSINSIWIVQKDGRILYCNHACLDLFEVTQASDILDKKACQFLHLEFQKPFLEIVKRVYGKQATIKSEIKMIRKDGEIIDIEAIFAPFYLDNQIFTQVIMQNITERKMAEKQLNDREKLASLGQIAAGIAHEVKNPLTAVKGFLQLSRELNTNPYIDIMETELDKALTTLENLLQVSKPDLFEEPIVAIDLCKELSSLSSLFQDKLYRVELELNLRDSGQKFLGKRNLLQKALFNLIKNAVEAIEDKGRISIEHFCTDNMIHIKISDTGVGIPQEKIKMLGTPFYTSKDGGTGLGLTQVCTTIHEHNGRIRVQSQVGKGTTIHIQLPAFQRTDCESSESQASF